MPFIAEPLVRLLWGFHEGHDTVILTCHGLMEPTYAFHSTKCLEPVGRALARGANRATAFHAEVRLRPVLDAEWQVADPEGISFRNINTPEEYRTAAPQR